MKTLIITCMLVLGIFFSLPAQETSNTTSVTNKLCPNSEARRINPLESQKILAPVPPLQVNDSDNDGLPDDLEMIGVDCDNDGIENIMDPDSDNDGYIDGIDKCVCDAFSTNNGCPYDERLVFFSPGFQGDIQSWNLQYPWLQQNCDDSRYASIVYNDSQNSMSAAVATMVELTEDKIALWQDIDLPNKSNFFVVHSMGGMVFRNAEENIDWTNLPVNGFISFGTAHLGVPAADSKVILDANGQSAYERFINEACEKLSASLGTQLLSEQINVGSNVEAVNSLLVGSFYNIANAFDEVSCSLVSPAVFSLVETGWSDNIQSELTTEQAQDWPAPTTAHNLAVYAVEDDDVTIVMTDLDGSTFDQDVTNTLTPRFLGGVVEKAGDQGLWGADVLDDVGLELFANTLARLEHNKTSLNQTKKIQQALAVLACSPIPFTPGLCLPVLLSIHLTNNNIANNLEAMEFINNIDFFWKDIIGASETTIISSSSTCNCVAYEDGEITEFTEELVDGSCEIYNSVSPVSMIFCEMQTETISIVTEDSDGFIPAINARSMPGASYPPEIMVGSSHFQMRNDSEARRLFRKIFLGIGDHNNTYEKYFRCGQ